MPCNASEQKYFSERKLSEVREITTFVEFSFTCDHLCYAWTNKWFCQIGFLWLYLMDQSSGSITATHEICPTCCINVIFGNFVNLFGRNRILKKLCKNDWGGKKRYLRQQEKTRTHKMANAKKEETSFLCRIKQGIIFFHWQKNKVLFEKFYWVI